ncbi:hypothetical protein STZ1_40348 [Bacillus subtilis]|nr:hypothetical protein [Bacillus inaquosorum]
MTTDFLLTINRGQGIYEVARTIKMKDELLKENIFEGLGFKVHSLFIK